jgi:hypothetical protein
MSRNVNPGEGGPAGGQLEAKIGAFYFLSMLAEAEPRGMPGCTATKVKFQRTYEGHALDDIIVLGVDADGNDRVLEIQSKRTTDFTASDAAFGKTVAQIVAAGPDHVAPVAIAIARTNAKIERHYQQLLLLARKTSTAEAFARAVAAERVVSQGMRDFAAATRAQIGAASGDTTDEAVWRLLRRLQILVFDFESVGALSATLVEALCRLVLAEGEAGRHRDLWAALQTKALSYDADGGEITRAELIGWLSAEQGLQLKSGRDLKVARRRFGDASDAALAAIDDTIAGVHLARSDRVLAAADQLDTSRFLEIVGGPGCGKSGILKALAEREGIEGRPLVLSPARTPTGGWLALSSQLSFQGSAVEFLTEMASSGGGTLYIDGLDRVVDSGVQATIVDLIWAVAKVPAMRLAATVGLDFSEEQRQWLPAGALTILGGTTMVVSALTDEEAGALSAADGRLKQLLNNPQAKPLTRNLYQLRQLLGRAADDLPISEAALARSWWERAPRLDNVRNRARQQALRGLAAQALDQVTELDVSAVDALGMEDLVQAEDVVEIFMGSRGLFRHDILRDWAGANLLIEQPDRLSALPLSILAPTGLARSVEILARWSAEQEDGADRWTVLLAEMSGEGLHGSWRRAVLLSLVRTEPYMAVLDRLSDHLLASNGALLGDLIRITEAADSASGKDMLVAMGVDVSKIPADFRTPTGPSWMRLLGWLLVRLDQISAPIGPDVLRFFRLWLTATGGRDAYAPLVVQTIYGWLLGLERQDRAGEAGSFSRLFDYDGRFGRRYHLGQDIRTLFFIFCGARTGLADAYLRSHIGDPRGSDVAAEVLELPQALAAAAPAAMADFTIDALITAEQKYEKKHGRPSTGRLTLQMSERLSAGPSRGPYLAVLRASKSDGLRLVRRIVDYGLGLDRSGDNTVEQFELDLPGGARAVTLPGAYFVARAAGESAVMASALRALESWGHERIEHGDAVEDVVADILGRDQSPIPAPLLAVAVDLLLSHVVAPDPRLIPYMASAELLRLDFDRFNRDRMGVHSLIGEDDGLTGPGSNADLWARPSRKTCLQWEASKFVLAGETDELIELRAQLRRQLDRFAAGTEGGPEGPYGLRWTVEHVLRLLDPSNWRQREVQLEDGSTAMGVEYIEPEVEASVLVPLRTSANANISETVVMSQAVEAAIDPSKATDEILTRGIEWAQAEDLASLREDENDFTVSQRWRAVTAVAVLVLRSSGHDDLQTWAAEIVERAAAPTDHEGGAYGMAQVRYHAPGLALLGLAQLAVQDQAGALALILELATRSSPAVVAAFGLVLEDLAAWRPECPVALLRTALDAATMTVRDWEDPERFEANKARRAGRLRDRRTIEERFLCEGGPEPEWPTPASTRYLRRRPRISRDGLEPDQVEELRDRVLDRFNEQLAGAWLTLFDASPWVRMSGLPLRITDTYRHFSNYLWGQGLDAGAEINRLPTEWLRPFARLRLRATCGMDWPELEAAFLQDLLDLPDQGFLDAVESVVPLADSLALIEGRPSTDTLVKMRSLLCTRLKLCGVWRWRHDEIGDTLARDLAGAVRALFVHGTSWIGPMKSLIPENAVAFGPIFPALVDLTRQTPGSEYIATLMMNDFERARDWASAELVVDAAEAWLGKRGSDTVFWRDHGFGGRVCTWLANRAETGPAWSGDLARRVLVLADRLAQFGVPEALVLEAGVVPA